MNWKTWMPLLICCLMFLSPFLAMAFFMTVQNRSLIMFYDKPGGAWYRASPSLEANLIMVCCFAAGFILLWRWIKR